MTLKQLRNYHRNKKREKLIARRKYFMKLVKQSQKNRKMRIENRRKLYGRLLEKKDNVGDKTAKRKFNKDKMIT